ncbi:N-acetylglucosamine-6-phosphate deacetylase, partial [Paracoccus sanguinis]
RHIRPLDDRTLTLAESLRADGIPLLLTLAPEAATPAQIARLAAAGVVVSLGHSDATAVETEAALAAGAGNFTHLFNAMSQMQGREPGMVGAAILSDAEIGLICDGHHVSDAMLTLALRAHGAGRCHIVSDAMPTVGGPDHFTLYGQTIRVENGRLINAEGRLAGAHTTMAEGVARLVTTLGQPLEAALLMAITNPARVIGADPSLESQPAADLLLWDAALKPRFLTEAMG